MRRWLLLLVALVALVMWQTGTAPLDRAVDRLASQSQLGDTLRGTDLGTREDALSLLVLSTVGAPLALAVGLATLAFVLAALAEAVRPAMRALALPDPAARVTGVIALALGAWLIRDAWLPRSLWVLGVLARAYRVVVT